MLHVLDRTRFEPYLGETFTVKLDAGRSLPVELIRVRDADTEGASLVFEGMQGCEMPLGTQIVYHGELGRFFMVFAPIDASAGGAPRVQALLQPKPTDG